jgi:hypothetical protein
MIQLRSFVINKLGDFLGPERSQFYFKEDLLDFFMDEEDVQGSLMKRKTPEWVIILMRAYEEYMRSLEEKDAN